MSTARLSATHDDLDEAGLDETDPTAADLPAGVDTCSACRHPRESHDATSLRFCAATTNLGVDRRCICRVENLNGAQQAASSHRFGAASTVPRGV
jgi:hypothetical protein